MQLMRTYLDEDLEPTGFRTITEKFPIIDDYIYNNDMWSKISVNPPFQFVKIELSAHRYDSPRPYRTDPYHLAFVAELPINTETQLSACDWVCDRIEDELVDLAKIVRVPKMWIGSPVRGIVSTPAGQGYIEVNFLDNIEFMIGTPITREHTVDYALNIAKGLDIYMGAIYAQAEKIAYIGTPSTIQ